MRWRERDWKEQADSSLSFILIYSQHKMSFKFLMMKINYEFFSLCCFCVYSNSFFLAPSTLLCILRFIFELIFPLNPFNSLQQLSYILTYICEFLEHSRSLVAHVLACLLACCSIFYGLFISSIINLYAYTWVGLRGVIKI